MSSEPIHVRLNGLGKLSDDEQLLGTFLELLRDHAAESSTPVEDVVSALEQQSEITSALERALRRTLGGRRLVHALAESGILSDRGIFSEVRARLSDRLLPLPSPEEDVRRLIRRLCRTTDWRWILQIADESWGRLFELFVHEDDFVGIPHDDIAAAILGLAQRAGALGIDEELNARLTEVEDYDSPFLDLTHLAWQLLDDHADGRGTIESVKALRDCMGRSRELIEHLRANKATYGTSLRLTAITRRLLQQLRRIELLLHLVHPKDAPDFARSLAPVFKEIVEAELTRNSLARLLHEHADLFAFQIVEETAKKGVKYVTDSAAGYWTFLRKAIQGGAIVAVFAILKALAAKLDLSLGGRAFVYSVNYATCFVLIYLTGSILATKQPAMTASAIGRRIDEARSDERAVEAVGEMVIKVWRSQFVSFVGNLICALPMAMLIVWGLGQAGLSVADAPKASKLLAELDPVRSGALFYAGVAGVYLFLSGVLSGWFDNYSTYSSLRERIANLPWPGPLAARGDAVAKFVDDNLGVVMGNVILGGMLGTAGTIGYILDSPFDIRHIAFSSANFGVAIVTAPQLISLERALWCVVGVIGIGFVNFIVSFGLTLTLTLESRQTKFTLWRLLAVFLFQQFVRRPRDWFLPPTEAPPGEQTQPAP